MSAVSPIPRLDRLGGKCLSACARVCILTSLSIAAALPLLIATQSPLGAQDAPTSQNSPPPAQEQAGGGQSGSLTGASANFAPNPKAGERPSQARDYANTRFSPLDQINTKNVDQLRVAWTFFRQHVLWP